MTRDHISRFLSLLTESRSSDGVFNPWKDVDKENDLGPRSPEIRKRHLRHYLETRVKTARYLIIGEAVGYQGGHFSGIAMTSERILLGFQKNKGIYPENVLSGLEPQRTSKPERMPRGFTEPTATIVWGTLLNASLGPTEFALWNAFAWHPFDTGKGMLSNRRPKAKEMTDSLDILEKFVRLFSGPTVIAMGKVAEEWLNKLEIHCYPVRHPAQGGASKFRRQLSRLLKKS